MYLHHAAALGYKDAVVRNPRRTGRHILIFSVLLQFFISIYVQLYSDGDVAQWLERLTLFYNIPERMSLDHNAFRTALQEW